MSVHCRLCAALALLVLTAACGSLPPESIEGTSLKPSYRSLGSSRGTIRLELSEDRTFALARGGALDDEWGLPEAGDAAGDAEALSGTWETRGGDLLLTAVGPGAGLELVFTECETQVDAVGRTALLPGLHWVRSSAPTFADSTELVSHGDLTEFLHPTAGSGSRGSAL
jgi:hypothetical protein